MIQDNKIKNLEKAALVTKISQPKLKKQAIEACLKGATLKELKQLARAEKKIPIFSTPAVITKSTRGRSATRINLGNTENMDAVKFLIESVLATKKYRLYKEHFLNVVWDDYKSMSEAFKRLMVILEKTEG